MRGTWYDRLLALSVMMDSDPLRAIWLDACSGNLHVTCCQGASINGSVSHKCDELFY